MPVGSSPRGPTVSHRLLNRQGRPTAAVKVLFVVVEKWTEKEFQGEENREWWFVVDKVFRQSTTQLPRGPIQEPGLKKGEEKW